MEAQFTSGTRASPLQSFMYEPSYPTYGNPVKAAPRNRKRHDSMLQNPQMALRPADTISGVEQRPHTRRTQTPPKGQHQAPRPDRPSSVPVPKQAAFRFCVTTNPQVKDKDEMRENRKHVMHDFLRKEGRKTSGPRDARAAGPLQPNQPEKRRRLESSTTEAPKSLNPAAPMRMFGPGVLTPQSSCEAMGSGRHCDSESEESTMAIAAVPTSHIVQDITSYCGLATNSQPFVEEDEQSLEERQEAEHASSETGDLFSLLGFRVGPYHSFFQATRPNVDLEKLKYDCGRRLRSDSMVTTWLPTLVRAKHCFLSTICISAAHEEAIREVAFGTQNVRALQRNSAYERLAVKSQVHGMINAILDDPERRTSDETIVAVMNMLNSEMIGCDLEALRVHQTGINSMVLMRGGLDDLGVHGHLARTLTITMLVNSVLQERVADNMYLHYAQRQAAPSTTNGTTSRASMFYCGVLEWADLNRFLSPRSETMALLNLVRKLTGVFRGNADSRKANLQRLRDQIWEFKEKTSAALPTQGDRVYEAVRLTARVYADALAKRTPFSKACRTAESTESGTSDTRPAAFVQIAQSLSHTNLQDYWGGLSGVLFWVALVAGAAAKRALSGDPNQSTSSTRKQQEDAASRLLAAVAVRGSIVFGFEQGPAVLGTLSNMLDLQDRLSGRSGRTRGRAVFGPERLIGRQRGFSDFAEEFRSVEE